MATLTQIAVDLNNTDSFQTVALSAWEGRRVVIKEGYSTTNIIPLDGGSTPSGDTIDYVWGN